MFPFSFMWMCSYLFGTTEKMLLMLYSFSACDPFAWMHLTSSSRHLPKKYCDSYILNENNRCGNSSSTWLKHQRHFQMDIDGYLCYNIFLYLIIRSIIFSGKIDDFKGPSTKFEEKIQEFYTLKPQSTYDEIEWIHSIF